MLCIGNHWSIEGRYGEAGTAYQDSKAPYLPHFCTPPLLLQVLRHLCVVNFSVTRSQMSELLITATMRHEMPQLDLEQGVLVRQKVWRVWGEGGGEG